MNLDLEAMKAAALAATPGRWATERAHVAGSVWVVAEDGSKVLQASPCHQPRVVRGDEVLANAVFVAAANPAAVLDLIERLERTERNRDIWKEQCERQTEALTKLADTTNGFPDIKGDSLPTLRKRFSALYAIAWAKEHHLEAVQRDLDALRASANPDALESERQANAMLTEENDRLQKALEAARAQIPEPSPLHHRRIIFTESADYDCWKCYRALVADGIMPATRMVLCPVCGNKRCPKASDHDLACTGSNEPGQPGSVY